MRYVTAAAQGLRWSVLHPEAAEYTRLVISVHTELYGKIIEIESYNLEFKFRFLE